MSTTMLYQAFADEVGAPVGTIKRWAHEGMPTLRMGARVVVFVPKAYAWLAQRRPRFLSRTGVVYFAQQGDGAVKVGFTSDLPRRISELGHPRVLATMPGTIALELSIHEMLEGSRISGEWYRPTDEVMGLVQLLEAA